NLLRKTYSSIQDLSLPSRTIFCSNTNCTRSLLNHSSSGSVSSALVHCVKSGNPFLKGTITFVPSTNVTSTFFFVPFIKVTHSPSQVLTLLTILPFLFVKGFTSSALGCSLGIVPT